MFYKIFTKKYTFQMLLSSKTKKYFQKWFFKSKLKNIPKGVWSTKCPVATWRKKTKKYKTLSCNQYICCTNMLYEYIFALFVLDE
jgi:hypothetical protein